MNSNSNNNNNNNKDEKQQDIVSANNNLVKDTVNNDENGVAAVLPAAKCNNSIHNYNNGGKGNGLAKQHAMWLAIKVEPCTYQYFEPTMTQMKLVLECDYTPAEAYNTGGDQNQPCSICKNATDEPFFYQDAINICSAAGREQCKIEPYLHKNVEMHKKMYAIFFQKKYVYLCKVTGKTDSPRLPLPYCFGQGIKKNPLAQPTLDLSAIAKNVLFNIESIVVLSNMSFRKFIYKIHI